MDLYIFWTGILFAILVLLVWEEYEHYIRYAMCYRFTIRIKFTKHFGWIHIVWTHTKLDWYRYIQVIYEYDDFDRFLYDRDDD